MNEELNKTLGEKSTNEIPSDSKDWVKINQSLNELLDSAIAKTELLIKEKDENNRSPKH